jgi:uncharacterized membrane protein YdjX (TVP38/TMEM64 family)
MLFRNCLPTGGTLPCPRLKQILAGALTPVPALVDPAWLHALSAWSSVTIDHVRTAVAQWGPWAPVTSILITVLNTFLPFPTDLIIVANGAVFGFWNGLLVSVIGAMASACLAFGIARLAGREAARRLVPASGLAWVDRTVTQGGWRAVLLIQFIPLLPYSLLNFALGLTSVPWATFLWVTVLSILPTDIVLVALGHGVAKARTVLYWTIAALILLTSLTIWLRRRLARVLKIPTKLAGAPSPCGNQPTKAAPD